MGDSMAQSSGGQRSVPGGAPRDGLLLGSPSRAAAAAAAATPTRTAERAGCLCSTFLHQLTLRYRGARNFNLPDKNAVEQLFRSELPSWARFSVTQNVQDAFF